MPKANPIPKRKELVDLISSRPGLSSTEIADYFGITKASLHSSLCSAEAAKAIKPKLVRKNHSLDSPSRTEVIWYV